MYIICINNKLKEKEHLIDFGSMPLIPEHVLCIMTKFLCQIVKLLILIVYCEISGIAFYFVQFFVHICNL